MEEKLATRRTRALVIAPPWSESKLQRPGGYSHRAGMDSAPGRTNNSALLESNMRFFKGGSFLDVGTGRYSCHRRRKLFPEARFAACDTDPEAVEIAIENARWNGVAEQIDFRGLIWMSCREPATSQPILFAPSNRRRISTLLPALVGASCGRLVLSGILDSQVRCDR